MVHCPVTAAKATNTEKLRGTRKTLHVVMIDGTANRRRPIVLTWSALAPVCCWLLLLPGSAPAAAPLRRLPPSRRCCCS
jgi:hypothetical protein